MSADTDLLVATFNVHAGIDGWGRPYDAVAACRSLDADVLVIEENWNDDGAPSIAELVAGEGDHVVTAPAGAARKLVSRSDDPHPPSRWGPPLLLGQVRPIRFEGPPVSRRARATPRELRRETRRGTWSTALISRFPVLSERLIPLPKHRSDPASRSAIAVELDVAGHRVHVFGAHFAHLRQGSRHQFKVVGDAVRTLQGPAVVLGDFNCWGPLLRPMVGGLHDAVGGATWPAWRPHSRIDHVLVNDPSIVLGGEVRPQAGSDHLPVVCRLRLRD